MTYEPEDDRSPRPTRKWRHKFREAFSGVKRGMRGQSSFCVHFFVGAMVLAAAVTLECELWEWCVLIACIGAVITTELINSALETLFHGLDEPTKNRIEGCLDIAAGAVLIVSATAVIIGVLILGNRFLELFRQILG